MLEFVSPDIVITLPIVLDAAPAGINTLKPTGKLVIVAPVAAVKLYVNAGIALLIHVAVLVPDGATINASGLIVIVPVIVLASHIPVAVMV